jgi:hypothetical protein
VPRKPEAKRRARSMHGRRKIIKWQLHVEVIRAGELVLEVEAKTLHKTIPGEFKRT